MDLSRFTWGDLVSVRSSAPARFRPGATASVVSIAKVTSQLAVELQAPVGVVLCTIEFGDGSDALVPEELLELARDT